RDPETPIATTRPGWTGQGGAGRSGTDALAAGTRSSTGGVVQRLPPLTGPPPTTPAPGDPRPGRPRRPRAPVPHGPHRPGGQRGTVDRRPRQGAGRAAPVASHPPGPGGTAGGGPRDSGAHLLQGRVGLA